MAISINNPLLSEPEATWELFHENSKLKQFYTMPPAEKINEQAEKFKESLEYSFYPDIKLPASFESLKASIGQVIAARFSADRFLPYRYSLRQIATLLHFSYGTTRRSSNQTHRAIPSGGGLYPLEIFFYCTAALDFPSPGLYHYNPARGAVNLLDSADLADRLIKLSPYTTLVETASLIVFVTATFQKTIFKYGDRGYRFALIEAGHLAQNLTLVATALSLNSRSLGGFWDSSVDEFLRLDGLYQSTIYMVLFGG